MNVIVCIKQIPDPEIPPVKFKLDPTANRVLPPEGAVREEGREPDRSEGGGGLQVGFELHWTRRRDRMHGQRGGLGHGYHGFYKDLRGRAGQLS